MSRREAHALAAFQGGPGQHQEAQVLVRSIRVDAGPVEHGGTIDEVEPEVSAREPGGLQGILELVATDLDREPLQFRDRLPFGPPQFHQAVQRYEYPHIVPVPIQVAAERRRNVAKAAGLCEGRNLRGQETDTLTHGTA